MQDTILTIASVSKRYASGLQALHDVDLGFGFLTRHHGKGYGWESAAAVLEHGQRVIGLRRIVAITSPDNVASSGLLEKLGFALERTMELVPGDEVKLYAC